MARLPVQRRLIDAYKNYMYRVGQKSKLLILSEYVSKTEKTAGTRTKYGTATEKMKHCLLFSSEIFYVTIVLCLNIL